MTNNDFIIKYIEPGYDSTIDGIMHFLSVMLEVSPPQAHQMYVHISEMKRQLDALCAMFDQ